MSTGRVQSGWLAVLGGLGNAAKGVVYGVIAVLALQAAFGAGGSTEGSRGAIHEIAQQPFGTVLLIVLAVGLAAYVVWRLVEAFVDPKGRGHDARGLAHRAAFVVSAAIYGSLAYLAMRIALDTGGGSGQSREALTATLLDSSVGRIVVGAAGVAIIVAGLVQLYRGWTASFMKRYDTTEMDRRTQDLARKSGQFGLSARGVVFGLIGLFVLRAAIQLDASETGGLGEALSTLAAQPYGPYLLAAVSAGLLCYAVYCFFRARYYRFE